MGLKKTVKKLTRFFFPFFWILSCSAFWPFSCSENSPTPHFLVIVLTGAAVKHIASGGQSVSLKAIGIFSDGVQQDITGYMKWTISNPNLGSIDANSVFTSSASGAAGVATILGVDSVSGIRSEPFQIKVTGQVTSISTPSPTVEIYARPNSREVWALSQSPGGGIYVIDTDKNTISNILTPPGGRVPGHLFFLPDGSKAYLSTSSTGAIYAIDGNTKSFGAVFPTNTDAAHLTVTSDGASVFYCETVNSTHVMGVYEINTITDIETLFDDSLAGPTAIAMGASETMLVGDGGHLGGGYIYSYPSYHSSTPVTSYQLSSWSVSLMSSSPDGNFVFAAGTSTPSYLIRTTDNQTSRISSDYGPWTFFNDNARGLWARMGAAVFSVISFSSTTLQVLDSFPYAPAGKGAITSDQTLYLPALSPNRIEVYQYY